MAEGNAIWLSDGLGLIDLKFRGKDNLIAAYLLDTPDGLLVIETGPANAADRLLEGIRELGRDPGDIRHVAVTHIHLDHAGAAGALLRCIPDATFYVHSIGARHMIDPSRLLDSAGRVYGAQMETLWGVMEPVPEERLVTVEDGDTLRFGGLEIDVLYTPGHASHHVSYAVPQHEVVVAGDVAGVRVPPSGLVWPPTPPPDIDAEAWHASISRLRDLNPRRLLLTHFGPVDNVTEHLGQLDARIERWVDLIASLQDEGLERDELADRLAADAQQESLAAGEATDVHRAVSNVTPFGMAVDGLTRYLRKNPR